MGLIRAGKLRAFQGGANPLYTRRKRKEMGKGVERKRQVVYIGSGFQQSWWFFKVGGCGSGTKKVLYLLTER